MRNRILAILVVVLALPLIAADDRIAFKPEAIVWKDAPASMPAGTKIALLEGDLRGDGFFTVRLRVPAGSSLPPHWHPRPERTTVLSGVVDLGFGKVVTRYPAGSFYVNPPRVLHHVSFPVDTELQITGIGPWEVRTDKQ